MMSQCQSRTTVRGFSTFLTFPFSFALLLPFVRSEATSLVSPVVSCCRDDVWLRTELLSKIVGEGAAPATGPDPKFAALGDSGASEAYGVDDPKIGSFQGSKRSTRQVTAA
jgi:hypothetical protein